MTVPIQCAVCNKKMGYIIILRDMRETSCLEYNTICKECEEKEDKS